MNYKDFETKAYFIFDDLYNKNMPEKSVLDYANQEKFTMEVEGNYKRLMDSIGYLQYLLFTTKKNHLNEIEHKTYKNAYRNLTYVKHKEYSNNTNVFSNFEDIKKQVYPYVTDTKAIMQVLAAKHYNWIDKHKDHLNEMSEEAIIEHFGDTINYLILIYLYGV